MNDLENENSGQDQAPAANENAPQSDNLGTPPAPPNNDSEDNAPDVAVEKTAQEKAADKIRLVKRTAEYLDESGIDDETFLLALSRRKGITPERSGAIQSFVERLKEVR